MLQLCQVVSLNLFMHPGVDRGPGAKDPKLLHLLPGDRVNSSL